MGAIAVETALVVALIAGSLLLMRRPYVDEVYAGEGDVCVALHDVVCLPYGCDMRNGRCFAACAVHEECTFGHFCSSDGVCEERVLWAAVLPAIAVGVAVVVGAACFIFVPWFQARRRAVAAEKQRKAESVYDLLLICWNVMYFVCLATVASLCPPPQPPI